MKAKNKTILLIVPLMVFALNRNADLKAQGPEKPNIVYILADDLGYGDISCYNPESKINTPKIDNLATEGMKFTDAHAPAACCTPTRYCLMTGRYAWRGLLQHGVIEGNWRPLLEPGRETVASFLQKNGYHTAAFGKWHLGMRYQTKDGEPAPYDNLGVQHVEDIDFTKDVLDGPYHHGFDESKVSPGCPTDDIFNFWVHNNEIPYNLDFSEWWVIEDDWEHEQVDTLITRWAIEFMEDHVSETPDEPFFLYVPLSVPHIPWLPPEFVKGMTGAGERGDQVFLADWCVEKIDSALHALGLDENTIFIFTSDNGPREGVNGHSSSGPFRGYKGDIYEGGHRIPLIVRWPGMVEANSVCDSIVGLQDLFATCAAILGQDLPVDVAEDSYNILPYFLGDTLNEPVRKDIIYNSCSSIFALRTSKWLLIAGSEGGGYYEDPVTGGTGQLYDMENDPYQTANLWSVEPELVSELKALLEEYILQGYTRKMD